jgi:hypothetical protein
MPTDVDPGLEDAIDPEITLEPVTLRAEPGGQVQLTVKLRNPGRYVESYSLHLNGLPQSWWQASPPEVPVYAHSDASATIAISPPVGVEIPPGPIPFAVIAVSTRDDRLRAAEEADLEVGRVFAVQAGITPVTSSARWSGRHRLTVSNWGNGPAVLRLYGHDKDAKLGFLIRPEVISVPVGGEASARVRARPRSPFLRGQQVHLPFQIIGDPSATGGPPPLPGIRPDLPGAGAAARLGGSLAGAPGLRTPGMPAIPGAMPGMPGGAVAGPAGVLPAPVGGFSVDGAVLQRPVWPRTAAMVALIVALAVVALVVLMVKFSNVVGAKFADQAPGKPAGVAVTGTGPKGVDVRWQAVARAQQYALQAIDPKSKNAVGDPQLVKAPAVIQHIEVKEALTAVCYQVTASRLPDNVGEASEIACGSSLDGKLPDPKDVKAVLGADGASVQVSWAPQKGFGHLVLNNGAQLAEARAGLNSAGGKLEPGQACIAVVAIDDEKASSDPVKAEGDCLQIAGTGTGSSAGPTGPDTGTGTGTGTNGNNNSSDNNGNNNATGTQQPTQTQGTNGSQNGGLVIQAGKPLPPVVARLTDDVHSCVEQDTLCPAVYAEGRRLTVAGLPALVLLDNNTTRFTRFVARQQGFQTLEEASAFCATQTLAQTCIPTSSAGLSIAPPL